MKTSIKTITAFIIIFCMIFSNAVAFSDVDVTSDEGKAITKMQNCGYIQGFGDGTFRPNSTLTRAEFVTIINKMYGYNLDMENVFSDIKPEDWYYNDILIAVQAGYIKGHDDGTFRPDDAITREQVCVMMNRILNVELLPFSTTITDKVSDWARESVEKLISNRFFLLEDGGKFRALQPITRMETCVALEKCIIDVPIEFEPVNIEEMVREELVKKLEDIINIMETEIIPYYTYEVNVEIAEMVLNSMKKYISDPEYSYLADAQAAYEVYRKSGKASNEFKDLIFKNMNLDDIAILFDFFYKPEIVEK